MEYNKSAYAGDYGGIQKMARKSLIDLYREKFGEPPPTFGYDDDEWPQMVFDAIKSGKPMRPASDDIPEGALL